MEHKAPSAFLFSKPVGLRKVRSRLPARSALRLRRVVHRTTAPSRGRLDLIFPNSPSGFERFGLRLPMDECTLREMMAQGGYDVAVDVKFTVAEIGEMQHMVMKGVSKKEIQTTPKNDDDCNPMIQLLILGFYGGM